MASLCGALSPLLPLFGTSVAMPPRVPCARPIATGQTCTPNERPCAVPPHRSSGKFRLVADDVLCLGVERAPRPLGCTQRLRNDRRPMQEIEAGEDTFGLLQREPFAVAPAQV